MDYAGVDAALHARRPGARSGRRVPRRLRPALPGPPLLDGAGRRGGHPPATRTGSSRELDDAIRVHGLHVIKFIPEYAYRAGTVPGTTGRSGRSGRLPPLSACRSSSRSARRPGTPTSATGSSPSSASSSAGWSATRTRSASVTHGFPYRAFLEGDRLVAARPRSGSRSQNPRLHLEVSFPVRLGDLFDYPYREVWPTLEAMLRTSAPDNLLWGTDMPFQNRFCTYRQSRRWIETCGAADRRRARRRHGWHDGARCSASAARLAAGRARSMADARLVDGARARARPVRRRGLEGRRSAAAIGRGADLRIYTEFLFEEHILPGGGDDRTSTA